MTTETDSRTDREVAMSDDRQEFEEWFCRQTPAGTVIGDPGWWASRIYDKAARAKHCPQCEQWREAIESVRQQLSQGGDGWAQQVFIESGYHILDSVLEEVEAIDNARETQQ